MSVVEFSGRVKALDDAGIGSRVIDLYFNGYDRAYDGLKFDGKSASEVAELKHRIVESLLDIDHPDFCCAAAYSWNYSPVPSDNQPVGQVDMALIASMISRSYNTDFLNMDDCGWAGEVTPHGEFLPLKSPLSVAFAAKEAGISRLYVPAESAHIVAAAGVHTVAISGTVELADMMTGNIGEVVASPRLTFDENDYFDIQFVKGQQRARRALEIAVAGGHSMLMVGPPGEGKSLLAKCAGGIAPPLTLEESLEVSSIHQAAGKTDKLLRHRPVRMVDPTVTKQALVGGGHTHPYPGEVTLAHKGVLFIDEILQCSKGTIEALRGPMQDGYVNISRVNWTQQFPAQFQLLAAANPCPCGYYNHPDRECVCSESVRNGYMRKLSGPLLDRIPIRVFIQPLTLREKMSSKHGETSEKVRERVSAARDMQRERFGGLEEIACNDDLNPSIMHLVKPTEKALATLERMAVRLKLSSRGVDNTFKVARTIADLSGREKLASADIEEAVSYLEWTHGGVE